MNLSIVLPQQRLSYAEKKKDNFAWSKACVDAVSRNTYQFNGEANSYSTDLQRKLVNYRLYNNELQMVFE